MYVSKFQRLRIEQKQAVVESQDGLVRLLVNKGGEMVPQESIFDMNTPLIKRQDDDVLDKRLPRPWVAQLPKLALVYQNMGQFDRRCGKRKIISH